MRKWQRFGKVKGTGAALLAAVVAIATVSPGGAFTPSASGEVSVGTGPGLSFEAFALALADEVTQEVTGIVNAGGSVEQAKQAAETHVRAEVNNLIGSLGLEASTNDTSTSASFDTDAAVEKVKEYVQSFDDVDVSQTPPTNIDEYAAQAEAQEAELQDASSEEVIAALLALLTSAEAEAMAGIDAAEAAVLAIIDQARADAVAAFAQTDMPEMEAFVLAQIDAARVLVQQAFDQVRAQVQAAFAEARNRIIEELTGVDFGEALDEVLAEIARLQALVQDALDEVHALLQEIGGLGG